MKKTAFYILMFLCVAMGSCKQDDPNVQKTATQDMAGEWYVTYTLDGDDVSGGHIRLITSSTAANIATEMMVTDWTNPNDTQGDFWTYKVKVQAVPATKAFSATESVSSVADYNIKVNVLNGKVYPNMGRSKTGVKVDSIYFEIQFEDDDPTFGNTFVVSGHKRTGFTEDDY